MVLNRKGNMLIARIQQRLGLACVETTQAYPKSLLCALWQHTFSTFDFISKGVDVQANSNINQFVPFVARCNFPPN